MKNKKTLNTSQKRLAVSKRGKIFLFIFLIIIIFTILSKLVTSIIMDMGYVGGKFHLWYWKDIEITKHWGGLTFENAKPSDGWIQELFLRSFKHPSLFWTFTQFTWQTTIIISVIIFIRIFMYEETTPKWLKWTQRQTTLSIVAMYDVIVAIGFWSALAHSFSGGFSNDAGLRGTQMTTTFLVHAVIPFIMFIYSTSYLLFSTHASRLRKKTFWLGMIYPTLYILFYLLISTIWQDPYPVSSLRQHHWQAALVPVGVIIWIFALTIMIFSHNRILISLNRHYRFAFDIDSEKSKKRIIEKKKRKNRIQELRHLYKTKK